MKSLLANLNIPKIAEAYTIKFLNRKQITKLAVDTGFIEPGESISDPGSYTTDYIELCLQYGNPKGVPVVYSGTEPKWIILGNVQNSNQNVSSIIPANDLDGNYGAREELDILYKIRDILPSNIIENILYGNITESGEISDNELQEIFKNLNITRVD